MLTAVLKLFVRAPLLIKVPSTQGVNFLFLASTRLFACSHQALAHTCTAMKPCSNIQNFRVIVTTEKNYFISNFMIIIVSVNKISGFKKFQTVT